MKVARHERTRRMIYGDMRLTLSTSKVLALPFHLPARAEERHVPLGTFKPSKKWVQVPCEGFASQ